MADCRNCGIEYKREGGRRNCDDCIAAGLKGECVDCGEEIHREPGKTGPLRKRCAPCNKKFKGRQAYRYVKRRMEADPEFAERERARRREAAKRSRDKNRERVRARDREAHARAYADPEKRERIRSQARISRVARKYGLSKLEYEQLLDQFGHRCGICGGELEILCVDHNHTSGKVRGVLCQGCNIGLGGFRDDPDRLRGAIRYLSRYDG